MLPKKERLPVQSVVRLRGRSSRNNNFTVKAFWSSTPTPFLSRFGIVVSGKIVKGAVQRNKLKRMIYGVIEEIKSELLKADYLVITNKNIALDDKKLLREELVSLFREIINKK